MADEAIMEEPIETDPMESTEPRTIDQLIDLPYSEMTEEEIELVVNYKAEVKARDESYQAQIDAVNEAMQTMIQANQEIADANNSTLNALVSDALKRLEDEG